MTPQSVPSLGAFFNDEKTPLTPSFTFINSLHHHDAHALGVIAVSLPEAMVGTPNPTAATTSFPSTSP